MLLKLLSGTFDGGAGDGEGSNAEELTGGDPGIGGEGSGADGSNPNGDGAAVDPNEVGGVNVPNGIDIGGSIGVQGNH